MFTIEVVTELTERIWNNAKFGKVKNYFNFYLFKSVLNKYKN